jgi:DNA-binding helix-hairpin-helix protein with protein kinase domain
VTLRGQKSGDALLPADPLGVGGQGTVYAVAGRPDLALKVYDSPPANLGDRLAAMLARPPVGLLDLAAPAAVAWPLEALIDATGRCVGPALPRVNGRTGFGELVNPATRNPALRYDVLIRSARNLAATVAGLHAAGVVVGDLNPHNALVDAAGAVALIDTESAQVRGPNGVFRCPVGVPDLTPPEDQGIPYGSIDLRPAHDLFALGALVFMAFMDGNHPFAGTPARGAVAVTVPERIKQGWWPYARRSPYRPRRQAPPFAGLPAEVQALLRQCFETGHATPLARPSATTWVDVLDRVLAGPVVAPAANAPAIPTPMAGVRPTWPRLREWTSRCWEPVRRRPRTAAVVALVGTLGVGAGVWTQLPKQPPSPGGKPTPALWKDIRREPRR